MAMTPSDMASKSVVVQTAYSYLVQTAGKIADYGLRQRLTQVLENPVPSFLQMYNDTERKSMADVVTQQCHSRKCYAGGNVSAWQ
jgi:hypothetical protein